MQEKKRFDWRMLKGMVNLPLVAIVVGLIVAAFGVKVPVIISELTGSLAAFAVPLAMFYHWGNIESFSTIKS